jgi:protein TonB
MQPRELPDAQPTAAPADDPDPGPVTAPDGVIGGGAGEPAPELPVAPPRPAEPIEARPADVAAVRAALARTFVYPPEARRRALQGRVIVAITLSADGALVALELRESSGHRLLDEAALDACRRAAPFAPPGVAVRVVVPVSFRLF